MPRARATGAAAVVALALTLAACGSDDPAPTADDPTSAPEVPAPEVPEVGVIDELLAIDNEEAQLAFGNRVEELVVPCMAAKGFEYVPEHSELPEGDEPAPGSPEFVAAYGYGVITSPSPAVGGVTEAGRRNWAYGVSLSVEQQAAYTRALYGVPSGVDENDEEAWAAWAPTPEELGCKGSARQELGDGHAEQVRWAGLKAELDVLEESVLADSRVAEVDADWASCMADAGHPGFSAVADAQQSIHDQLIAIGDDMGRGDPNRTEGSSQESNEMYMERVGALGAVEVELATADFACRDEVGYQEAFDAVDFELQQEFRDAHQAELEGYVEYLTRKFS